MHAVLEFAPPLPPDENIRHFLSSAIVKIWGDERFEHNKRRPGAFATTEARESYFKWECEHYAGGLCRRCALPLGPRTEKPLDLQHVRANYGGGFVLTGSGWSYIFSERFLALLFDSELAGLEFREVICPPRCRTKFYELVGPIGLPLVGIRNLSPNGGWTCKECGGRVLGGYRRANFDLDYFIASDDLPQPLPDFFTVHCAGRVALAASAQRWSELIGRKDTKGILSDRVGVVSNEQLERFPQLPERGESVAEGEAKFQAWLRDKLAEQENRSS